MYFDMKIKHFTSQFKGVYQSVYLFAGRPMEPSEQEEDENYTSESEAEAEEAMNPPAAMHIPPEQVSRLIAWNFEPRVYLKFIIV